ncbi:MAG TPA: hypothetical protein VGX52_08830, partial [Burkholderiales bacterium]|nr:hypothetical protein [Burkholderiales bacterium]
MLLLAAMPLAANAAPSAVSTFHSIGLYWSPEGGSESNAARVEFRKEGSGDAWRQGLDLWFDARDGEYRGSLVELEPGTRYEIRLALASGVRETLSGKTWSEKFPIKRTVAVQPGKRLVIRAEDSGDEKGYVLFTAPPAGNVIEGNAEDASCVLVRQGAHHVIIRGLVLGNCKRYGILIERNPDRALDAQTHDVVIEDNEITGWGGFDSRGSRLADDDGAIYCNYRRETDDAKRPDRIVIQGNRIRDPRHGANPWQSAAHGRLRPHGPLGVMFNRCGRNHVIRYNDIGSANANHYHDGIGGADNFSTAGFPWADSDIYGNRVSEVYDDGIEAEGANRNVRIWGNHLRRVYVAIGNAATATGPLYVWRNVATDMARMFQPEGNPRRDHRGPFIKAGSKQPQVNGGRAYYFHNTAPEAGAGIARSGGPTYNFVARNNRWPASRVNPEDGPFDLGRE